MVGAAFAFQLDMRNQTILFLMIFSLTPSFADDGNGDLTIPSFDEAFHLRCLKDQPIVPTVLLDDDMWNLHTPTVIRRAVEVNQYIAAQACVAFKAANPTIDPKTIRSGIHCHGSEESLEDPRGSGTIPDYIEVVTSDAKANAKLDKVRFCKLVDDYTNLKYKVEQANTDDPMQSTMSGPFEKPVSTEASAQTEEPPAAVAPATTGARESNSINVESRCTRH